MVEQRHFVGFHFSPQPPVGAKHPRPNLPEKRKNYFADASPDIKGGRSMRVINFRFFARHSSPSCFAPTKSRPNLPKKRKNYFADASPDIEGGRSMRVINCRFFARYFSPSCFAPTKSRPNLPKKRKNYFADASPDMAGESCRVGRVLPTLLLKS